MKTFDQLHDEMVAHQQMIEDSKSAISQSDISPRYENKSALDLQTPKGAMDLTTPKGEIGGSRF